MRGSVFVVGGVVLQTFALRVLLLVTDGTALVMSLDQDATVSKHI